MALGAAVLRLLQRSFVAFACHALLEPLLRALDVLLRLGAGASHVGRCESQCGVFRGPPKRAKPEIARSALQKSWMGVEQAGRA